MIIIASKPGQLGNRLFVFANFISFSTEYNIPVINPSFDEYCNYFTGTQYGTVPRYPMEKKSGSPSKDFYRKISFALTFYLAKIISRLKIKNRLFHTIEIDWEQVVELNTPEFLSLAKKTRYLFVIGWCFRDTQHLMKHKSTIHQFLKPLPRYEDPAKKNIDTLRQQYDMILGVHIRQGDYKTFENGRFYFTSHQYATCMQKTMSYYPDKKLVFIVCSNEKQDNTIFDGLNCIWSDKSFMEDMVTLSLCDLIIGPPSTFSMWASFYGQTLLYTLQNGEDPVNLKLASVYS